MAGIDHALEGIPRYAGFKYKKKKRAETCVFRRSFRLFAALFFSPRPSFAVQNFFCFLTIFFPQSHAHTTRFTTRPNNKQRIRNIQNRRDIRASQGEAFAHDRANHQVYY